MNPVVVFRGFQYHYVEDGRLGPGWYTYVNGCVRVMVVGAPTLCALQASLTLAGFG